MASPRGLLPGTVTGDEVIDGIGGRIDRVMDNTFVWLTVTSGGAEGDDVTADIMDNADTPAEDTVFLERGWLAGMGARIVWPATNTGAVTLAVNSGTALNVLDSEGNALVAGQLPAGQVIDLAFYDGAFRVLSAIGSGTTTSPSWVLVEYREITTGTSVADFVLDGTYPAYRLHVIGAVPSAASEPVVRFRTSGGSFRTGATDYGWSQSSRRSSSTGTGGDTSNDSDHDDIWIHIGRHTNTVGVSAGDSGFNAELLISKPHDTARGTGMKIAASYADESDRYTTVDGMGVVRTAEDNDAIRFLFTTENIASGEFVLEGLQTS